MLQLAKRSYCLLPEVMLRCFTTLCLFVSNTKNCCMIQKTEKEISAVRLFSRFSVGITLKIAVWLLVSSFLFTTRPTWETSWHYGIAFFFWFYALVYGALYSYVRGSSPGHVVWLSLGSKVVKFFLTLLLICLLYTSTSPRDRSVSRLTSSA